MPDSWDQSTDPGASTYIVQPNYVGATNTLTAKFVGLTGGFGYPSALAPLAQVSGPQ